MKLTIAQMAAQSYSLTVSAALLAGQTLTGVSGCTVTIGGTAPTLPRLLAAGEVLAVTHTAGAGTLSGLTLETTLDSGTSAAAPIRLSDTSPFFYPNVNGSGGFRDITDAGGAVLRLDFTTIQAMPFEGWRLETRTGLTPDQITGSHVTDSTGGGVGLDSATFTAATSTAVAGRWDTPTMLPPGSYKLYINIKPGATLHALTAQSIYNATAFVIVASAGGESALGAGFTFLTDRGNALGHLAPGSMNVVREPSSDTYTWFNGACEIVAANGAVPYLRFRHEGQDYKTTMTLVP